MSLCYTAVKHTSSTTLTHSNEDNMELSALLLSDHIGSISSQATNLQSSTIKKKKWGPEKISILKCAHKFNKVKRHFFF